MKKNLLKMALLAFATFAASVASAQTNNFRSDTSRIGKEQGDFNL